MITLTNKFFIRVPLEKMNEPVQRRLFYLGFAWRCPVPGLINGWQHRQDHIIMFNYRGDNKLSFCDESFRQDRLGGWQEVTLDELNLLFAKKSLETA